jgi:hypothetical protein
MQIKAFKNGYATFDKHILSGYYIVKCYKGDTLHDKIMCDDYRMAREYWRAFCKLAKAS